MADTKLVPYKSNGWVAPVAIVAGVGLGGLLIYEALKKKKTVWQPCLTSLINSPVLTTGSPLIGGWQVCLTSLVTSPVLTVGTPSSEGWQACLTSLVSSAALIVGTPPSLGWQACLTNLITSPVLTMGTLPSLGWQACLTSLITSPTLTQIIAPPPRTAQIVVSPTTIATGQSITWTFYNFTPGQSVGVSLIGGGGLNITANALGSGTGSFVINETEAGQYGIQAEDSLGEYAMALFTVTVPNPPPVESPTFPVPGTIGDNQLWYWIKFDDGSIGWDTSDDLYYITGYTVLAGPYHSGATS